MSFSSTEIVFFILSCALFMGWHVYFFMSIVRNPDRRADAEADARRAAWEASLEE